MESTEKYLNTTVRFLPNKPWNHKDKSKVIENTTEKILKITQSFLKGIPHTNEHQTKNYIYFLIPEMSIGWGGKQLYFTAHLYWAQNWELEGNFLRNNSIVFDCHKESCFPKSIVRCREAIETISEAKSSSPAEWEERVAWRSSKVASTTESLKCGCSNSYKTREGCDISKLSKTSYAVNTQME